jgi:trans-L-3-hydroxyproline dehydratase
MMITTQSFKTPSSWPVIITIDMHTGGEPLRVIIGGLPEIKGGTILEKRRYFREHFDHLRTGLMWEPRGHADMYGAILTEPTSEDADFGVFFIHNEGYSTMCGHAIIALTKLVLDTGMIVKDGDEPELIINAPPGKIFSKGYRENGVVKKTSFRNVPSFVLLKDKKVKVKGIGEVRFDVAFGGAFYAFVRADEMDLKLVPGEFNRLVDLGRRIKLAVMEHFEITHPFEEELSFLYGTIFTGPPLNLIHYSRNVCIFADGELDRSATGSGVSARAALHFEKDGLKPGEVITIESILGTEMKVSVKEVTSFGPHRAVIPEVSGTAHFTGNHSFCFDPEDPLGKGFIFR